MIDRKEESANIQNKFEHFEKLPTDLKKMILNALPGSDILKQLTTSKSFNQNATFNHEYKMIQKGRSILDAAKDVPESIKKILNNPDGLCALGQGLITVETACKFKSLAKLQMLIEGRAALKECYITIRQANEFVPSQLKLLLSQNGLFAMRNKLIKPQNAMDISIGGLSKFLQKENLQELLKRKTEEQQAASIKLS